MNFLHMKYVVEVARIGSINKAAQTLLIAQPNLSRAIKEVEAELGITIFERSAKGMFLTPQGDEFISYATQILNQLRNMEKHYSEGLPEKQRFSIAVPGASYVSDVFARFSARIGNAPTEIIYRETDNFSAIDSVVYSGYHMAFLRYAENYDNYFKTMLEEKNLAFEEIRQFRFVLLMNRENPLASKEKIYYSDLESCIEIVAADPGNELLPSGSIRRAFSNDKTSRKIYVFERASRVDILSKNKEAIMWMSPVSEESLNRYNLVQRACEDEILTHKYLLIYRKNRKFTELDEIFIEELRKM